MTALAACYPESFAALITDAVAAEADYGHANGIVCADYLRPGTGRQNGGYTNTGGCRQRTFNEISPIQLFHKTSSFRQNQKLH
jgi:hypothetical protein